MIFTVLGLVAFAATQLPIYLTGLDVPVGRPVPNEKVSS